MSDRHSLPQPVHYRRFSLMVAVLVIGFSGLGFRLVDLQLLRHEGGIQDSEDRTQRTIFRTALRGNIYDARKTLLASSEFSKTVCVKPSLLGTNLLASHVVARALAPLLKISEPELLAQFQKTTRLNTNGVPEPRHYLVLKSPVSLEDWELMRTTLRKLDFGLDEKKLPKSEKAYYQSIRREAIFAEAVDGQQRFYPNDTLAAHVLGFTTLQDRDTDGRKYREPVGQMGVEAMVNQALTGLPGWRKTEMAKGSELASYRAQDIAPRRGHDVMLTIDAGVQHILETELAEAMAQFTPKSISGVVVRPRTGEIVALANLPTFNPNDHGASTPEDWRNRAIADNYEPGSTFKIVTVAGSLNEGLVTLQSLFDCEHGQFWFANKPLKDDHPMGVATVEEIIARSSNIGTAKMGLQLGRDRLYQYIRAFGFHQPTRLGLQGEEKGILSQPHQWSQVQSSRVPIGQGVAVTPIQMVMATAALANEGRLMQPYLVDRLIDEEGRVVLQNQPRIVRQVVSEETARAMITALKQVVSKNGTAERAMLEHYTVAGKTGTGETPGPGGYIPGCYTGSFIGFFPADQPELCIGIVLEGLRVPKPYYGSQTAAPTFRKVAERTARYLALKPDVLSPEQQLAATNRPRQGGSEF